MNKEFVTIRQIAELVSSHLDNTFLEAARLLRELRDDSPAQFTEVVEAMKIGKRRAYYLAQIDRQFGALGINPARLYEIGWTKLQVIGPFIGKANCEELLALAEAGTVHELKQMMQGEKPDPNARCVVLYLSPQQYGTFEAAVVKHGGVKSGRGLLNKEKALTKALSKAIG